jgi:hypothetical protein
MRLRCLDVNENLEFLYFGGLRIGSSDVLRMYCPVLIILTVLSDGRANFFSTMGGCLLKPGLRMAPSAG